MTTRPATMVCSILAIAALLGALAAASAHNEAARADLPWILVERESLVTIAPPVWKRHFSVPAGAVAEAA